MGRKCSLCHEYAISTEIATFACKARGEAGPHLVCADCLRFNKWSMKRPGFFEKFQCPCEATRPAPIPYWQRPYVAMAMAVDTEKGGLKA